MKEDSWFFLLLCALAGICGILGGCGAAAAISVFEGRRLQIAQALAYALIGLVSALLFALFGWASGDDLRSVLRWALVAGVGVPMMIGGHNLTVRFELKRRYKRQLDIKLKPLDLE